MDRTEIRRGGFRYMLAKTQFPSVASYICLSFVISGVALASIVNMFKTTPEMGVLLQEEIQNSTLADYYAPERVQYLSSLKIVQSIFYIATSQPMIWACINTYFACLALAAKMIIRFAFKDLTRQEEAVVRQGFFSFVMFSCGFLTVVAGGFQTNRVLPWLGWFGIVGFMTTLHHVAYQRFKFVSPSSGVAGGRLSWVCFFLFVMSTSVLMGVVYFREQFGLSHFLFLMVDSLLSLTRSLHGLLRCLSASSGFSRSPDAVRHFNYWLDLSVAIITDSVQLLNYIHLMLFSPLGFNLTCVFFFYHMKMSYSSMTATLSKHQKHKQIFRHIRSTYPTEVAEDDDLCIVCWEGLGESRRLPCGHQFHDWCLMWWLVQDASCPTCRRTLTAPQPSISNPALARPDDPPPTQTQTYRFGGGGFLRLPSFSIEFSTSAASLGPFFRRQLQHTPDDSQLTGMAQQVREMFPQLAMEVITEDLRSSGSAQATIENILEGRVGFVNAGLPEDESDEDDWQGGGGEVDGEGDGSGTEEEHSNNTTSESTTEDTSWMGTGPNGCTEYARRKRDMIATYRRRYIQSERGADLRARGYNA